MAARRIGPWEATSCASNGRYDTFSSRAQAKDGSQGVACAHAQILLRFEVSAVSAKLIGMSTLDVYAQDALQNSRSRFMAMYTLPFLLHKKEGAVATSSDEAENGFASHTQVAMTIGKTGTIAVLGRNAHLYAVYELKRRQREVTGSLERVSIGRSIDNDVTIADNAVSKIHAFFSQDDKNGMFLADAGSRNGTLVGGRKLAPGKVYPVDFGEPILLGGLALTLIGSGALWEIVQSQTGTPGRTLDYIEKK